MRAHGTFDTTASSVPEARRFVRRIAERTRAQRVVRAAELLVSELMTNAVLHARRSIQVVVVLDDRRLRVEVSDDGPGTPRIEGKSVWSESGRGLLLVDKISDRWGVEPVDDTKCVWFELAAH
jgi:anti-sigma regulatory factor (Ser/Thr protein kinase)